MGGAIALGLQKGSFSRLLYYDIDSSKASTLAAKTGGEIVLSLSQAMTEASVIVLSVKPQSFQKLIADTGKHFHDRQTVISIMAGITIKTITDSIPANVDIVRAMPNTPALSKEGLTALCCGSEISTQIAIKLFSGVGKTIMVQESAMDAVTAISGSGPAYVYYFIEALSKAAKAHGFTDSEVKTMVYQTLSGSLKLLTDSQDEPDNLRRKVTSPGGVTEAAIAELKAAGFMDIIQRAIAKGVLRSRALGK